MEPPTSLFNYNLYFFQPIYWQTKAMMFGLETPEVILTQEDIYHWHRITQLSGISRNYLHNTDFISNIFIMLSFFIFSYCKTCLTWTWCAASDTTQVPLFQYFT